MYSNQKTRSKTETFRYRTRSVIDRTLGSSSASAKPDHSDTGWVGKVGSDLSSSFTGYYSNPGWKSRLSKGFQAGSPANGTYETYDYSAARLWWQVPWMTGGGYYGKQEKTWEATGLNPYMIEGGSAASSSEANNVALKRVYQRLDGLIGDMKALVSAGEAAETIRMLRAPTQSLFKELCLYVDDAKRHVKKLRRRMPHTRRAAITRLTSVLSGLWLERSFGWNPLINDIDSALGSLTKLAQSPFEFGNYVISGKGESVGATPAYFVSQLAGLGADASVRWRQQRLVNVRYIVGVTMEPRDSLGAVKDAFGVHFAEFVPTVWELIPYSFVADYFTNIGDIVSAFAVSQRNIKWIVKTTKVESVNTIEELSINSWSISGSSPNFARVLRRPRGVYKKGSFTRELLSTLDAPSLEITLSDVSPLRAINLLALFRSSRSVEKAISSSLKSFRV